MQPKFVCNSCKGSSELLSKMFPCFQGMTRYWPALDGTWACLLKMFKSRNRKVSIIFIIPFESDKIMITIAFISKQRRCSLIGGSKSITKKPIVAHTSFSHGLVIKLVVSGSLIHLTKVKIIKMHWILAWILT